MMPWPRGKPFRISIRATVIGFFLTAMAITASVAISLQYFFITDRAAEATLSLYQETAAGTRDYLSTVDSRAKATIRVLSRFPGIVAGGEISDVVWSLFAEAMQREPMFYAIAVATDGGDLFQLINLEAEPLARRQLGAGPEDRWVAVRIVGQGEKRRRYLDYLDSRLSVRHSREYKTAYDPRKQPWFVAADSHEVYKAAPYLFEHLQAPGETYATVSAEGQAVLTLDMTLSSLSRFLRAQALSDDSKIYLYQETGELIAANQMMSPEPVLPPAPELILSKAQLLQVEAVDYLTVSNEVDWPPISFAVAGQPYGYAVDVLAYIAEMTGIPIRYVNGLSWNAMGQMFLNGELDVLQPVFFENNREVLGKLSAPFLQVPYGVATAEGGESITHIRQLFGKTVAVPEGWSLVNNLEAHFPQINTIRVANVRAMFNAVREGKADAAMDTAPMLSYTADRFFIDDVVIHQPLDFGDAELPTRLHFMINKTHAGLEDLFDLAIGALGAEHRQALREKWFGDHSRATRQLGIVPYVELIRMTQQKMTERLQRMTLDGRPHFVYLTPFGDAEGRQDYFAIITPVDTVLAPGLEKVKTSILLTMLAVLLLVPVSWLLASPIVKPIRQLATDSEKITQRRYEEVQEVSSNIFEVGELAGSMSNMSAAIQQHEKAQEELLDAFIKVIAQAIDDKSPHTAGHCERVPELAFMLAREAEKCDQGPFRHFAFKNAEEWREFQVAAWLHDCGKITTPEHIIDKGTKLETIYNRIHEIRMRFEVLWRDAEIHYLIRLAEPGADKAMLEREKNVKQQQLRKDFAFIANANIGGESVKEEDIARLHALAETTWLRYFDDQLGLSSGEMSRLQAPSSPLPAIEKLLADRPEHLIERKQSTDYDPDFGIKMTVPAYLYNLGELHNLSISRGTLSAEDRFKINEHIISTIKMLESLPFPEELRRVPRYASTHHETMKGTGYPRQLTGEDLSMPERIMVLADIYEALTAADRPYKKAKPISAALEILHRMVRNGHVDADVFELFLRSGVYLRYAERFLPAQQIDTVDIRQYLRQL